MGGDPYAYQLMGGDPCVQSLSFWSNSPLAPFLFSLVSPLHLDLILASRFIGNSPLEHEIAPIIALDQTFHLSFFFRHILIVGNTSTHLFTLQIQHSMDYKNSHHLFTIHIHHPEDYKNPHLYFLFICSHNREHLLLST